MTLSDETCHDHRYFGIWNAAESDSVVTKKKSREREVGLCICKQGQ